MVLRPAKQIVIAVLALLTGATGAAWADKKAASDDHDGDMPASVHRVQRETGGEVLKAQHIQRNGREVYRVKVLTPQGRIRVVEDEPPHRDPPPDDPPPRDHIPE